MAPSRCAFHFPMLTFRKSGPLLGNLCLSWMVWGCSRTFEIPHYGQIRFLHHVRSGLAKTVGLCINGALAMRVPLPNAYFSEIGPASGKFMLIFCSAGNPGFRRKIVAYTGGACARRRESKLTQCVPSPRQRNLTVHLSERARLRKS